MRGVGLCVSGSVQSCAPSPSPASMTPAPLTLAAAAAALLVCVRAGRAELPPGCMYEGRSYHEGALVTTREDCLRCVCRHGALSCRRRACAPLPDPLPKRCHVRHRRGACCPELHCPDGVKLMEHGAIARFESDESAEPEPEVATPSTATQACVEGGTVYAAGSAMGAHVACEQCYCLRGTRRCVRPRCLPPPPHCAPRPASGACCPTRYYCDRSSEADSVHRKHFDCKVNGTWISEGTSVPGRDNCTACFCLRGVVRCQEPHCAPPLAGCRPLLALGDCCAHQYICEHIEKESLLSVLPIRGNSLAATRFEDRAIHSSKSEKVDTTTKKILTSLYTLKHTPIVSATKNHLITTTKVKRKADEHTDYSSKKPALSTTDIISINTTTTQKSLSLEMLESLNDATTEKTTEQPEGTVKIVINGTINCTAELSSTSLPLSITLNDTNKIQMEVMPRVPIVNVEAQTYPPNDIITDRNVNGGFDENETFTINVTSSLMTNTSHSTTRPGMTVSKIPAASAGLVEALNISKKTKGDYDYDYTEPTLPPSLPNLKIIPFVAADAVVDEDPIKDSIIPFPMVDRQDEFPVYYPSADADTKNAFPNTRADTYNPTQYPVFVSEKVKPSYPQITDVDLTNNKYSELNDLGFSEYTVSTSIGSHVSDIKAVTKAPTTSTTFETPAVNLFSPPVETEGGFIPKSPGVSDEYYSVYPSTPSGPAVPHRTTSMRLDVVKSECIAQDGRHVSEGETISIGCHQCTCTWVDLRCKLRECHVEPGCVLLPPSNHSQDPCCGDLECDGDNETTSTTPASENKMIVTNVQVKNETSQPLDVILHSNDTNTAKTNKIATETVNNTTYTNNGTKIPKTSMDSVQNTTTAPITATKIIPQLTTTTPAPSKEANESSQEYEDDDDDFSFGSVLKLLLSESYDSTTLQPKKMTTTTTTTTTRRPTKPTLPYAKRPPPPPPTLTPFLPLPSHDYHPFIKYPNTVNRIDHLVLGEATAIKRTTLKPITNKTTKRPIPTTTERRPENSEDNVPFTSEPHDGPRPPNIVGLPGVGPGLLKLAGCNIYGRMYRVGRIIAELSTPCQECWCTELGVQCKQLRC